MDTVICMNAAPATSAYTPLGALSFHGTELTRGPWDPSHQHAGPPTALVCRAIEQAAAVHGLSHLARLTGNLLRPVPLGDLSVEVHEDYVGRNAAHYSARLLGHGKELARFTALMQREVDQPVPPGTPGHPLPAAPRPPADCEPVHMPFAGAQRSYADLVENRLAAGRFFGGPSSAWFRLRHPLVAGETPSPYQRVAVAADSGNGISAALDFRQKRPAMKRYNRRTVGIHLKTRVARRCDNFGIFEQNRVFFGNANRPFEHCQNFRFVRFDGD